MTPAVRASTRGEAQRQEKTRPSEPAGASGRAATSQGSPGRTTGCLPNRGWARDPRCQERPHKPSPACFSLRTPSVRSRLRPCKCTTIEHCSRRSTRRPVGSGALGGKNGLPATPQESPASVPSVATTHSKHPVPFAARCARQCLEGVACPACPLVVPTPGAQVVSYASYVAGVGEREALGGLADRRGTPADVWCEARLTMALPPLPQRFPT
jgi:hypothetical protein